MKSFFKSVKFLALALLVTFGLASCYVAPYHHGYGYRDGYHKKYNKGYHHYPKSHGNRYYNSQRGW